MNSHSPGAKSNPAKFDVAIVGGGITGLSTAMHLSQSGTDNIIIFDEIDKSATKDSPGFLSGSLLDNITRISVGYGLSFAGDLLHYLARSYRYIDGFLKTVPVDFSYGERFRLIFSQQEQTEAILAVKELKKVGFYSELLYPKDQGFPGALLGEKVVGIQNEGKLGGWVDVDALLSALEKTVVCSRKNNRIVELVDTGNGIQCVCEDGSSILAEMVCVTGWKGIINLIPFMKNVMIPYSDQWEEFSYKGDMKCLEHILFTGGHGYEWGGIPTPGRLVWGGGRFLRNLAGIGEKNSKVDPRVSSYLAKSAGEIFKGISSLKPSFRRGMTGCRPCDEIPVIGPMFGNERILVASGYMGTGLALGFMAGKSLSDLIMHGICDDLPELLCPKRFRSMNIQA